MTPTKGSLSVLARVVEGVKAGDVTAADDVTAEHMSAELVSSKLSPSATAGKGSLRATAKLAAVSIFDPLSGAAGPGDITSFPEAFAVVTAGSGRVSARSLHGSHSKVGSPVTLFLPEHLLWTLVLHVPQQILLESFASSQCGQTSLFSQVSIVEPLAKIAFQSSIRSATCLLMANSLCLDGKASFIPLRIWGKWSERK